MTTTKEILAGMLTENTGRHFLDSGGAYGRNWERNAGRDFEAEPESSLRFSTWQSDGETRLCVEVTHNLFHWLAERVEFNSDLNTRFREWCEENETYPDLEGMTGFVESIADDADVREKMTVNTYNGEDLLSQTIQYLYWTDSEGEHALIQIHGGCDVRGGYTDAKAFDLTEEMGLFDNARAHLYVDEDSIGPDPELTPALPGMESTLIDRKELACETSWHTDDGCHYYGEGADDLSDYPVEVFDDDGMNEDGESIESRKGHGAICIDDDGNGYCPVSGGRICASSY